MFATALHSNAHDTVCGERLGTRIGATTIFSQASSNAQGARRKRWRLRQRRGECSAAPTVEIWMDIWRSWRCSNKPVDHTRRCSSSTTPRRSSSVEASTRFYGKAERIRSELNAKLKRAADAHRAIDSAVHVLESHGSLYELGKAYERSGRITHNRVHVNRGQEIRAQLTLSALRW